METKELVFKLHDQETFIPISLLDNIVESTNFKLTTLEEHDSELFFKTYHGIGTVKFKNGIEYQGNLNYGILESVDDHATIKFKNGTTYIGEIHNNKISGTGKYIFPDGAIYNGEILNGLRHGYGVYEHNLEFIKYEGYWLNGNKHGNGIYILKNILYEGKFFDGLKHSYGKQKWITSGNYYEGQFKENQISGNGYMIWVKSKEKYIGQWWQNMQNGCGLHIWYEKKTELNYLKNRYLGEWKKGKRNGYGIFYYSNGSKYEGFWEDNMKHGFGCYTFEDGTQYVGKFSYDKMIQFDYSGVKSNVDVLTMLEKDRKREEELQNQIKKSKKDKNKRSQEIPTTVETKTSTNITNLKDEEFIQQEKNDQIVANRILKQADANPFATMLYITDILENENNIEKSLYEVESVLLRYLSDLKLIYSIYSGKYDLFNQEINNENELDDNAKKFSHLEKVKSRYKQDFKVEQIKNTNILTEGVATNTDLGFVMKLEDFWKILRDSYLLSPEFTLADFNRLFFQGGRNYNEMFDIPDNIYDDTVYDYIYASCQVAKENFSLKYCNEGKYANNSDTLYFNPIKFKVNGKIFEYDIHNGKNIVLMRQFYEGLARAASLRFNFNESLSLKIDHLIKGYLRQIPIVKSARKGTPLEKIIIETEPMFKNLELIKTYISKNLDDDLFNVFKNLCNQSKIHSHRSDLTLNYRYFYDNIIKKDSDLLGCFDIFNYIKIINKYHSNKPQIKDDNKFNLSTFTYIENLIDVEMIYFEFCDLVIYIIKKYCIKFKLQETNENINSVWEKIKDKVTMIKFTQKKNIKHTYFYPQTPYDIEYAKLIKDKTKKAEKAEAKKAEYDRMMRETKKMDKFCERAFEYKRESSEEEIDEDEYTTESEN